MDTNKKIIRGEITISFKDPIEKMKIPSITSQKITLTKGTPSENLEIIKSNMGTEDCVKQYEIGDIYICDIIICSNPIKLTQEQIEIIERYKKIDSKNPSERKVNGIDFFCPKCDKKVNILLAKIINNSIIAKKVTSKQINEIESIPIDDPLNRKICNKWNEIMDKIILMGNWNNLRFITNYNGEDLLL